MSVTAWYQIFDIGRHTVHYNDEKTKILVITKDQYDAKEKANNLMTLYNQNKWDFFEINPFKIVQIRPRVKAVCTKISDIIIQKLCNLIDFWVCKSKNN